MTQSGHAASPAVVDSARPARTPAKHWLIRILALVGAFCVSGFILWLTHHYRHELVQLGAAGVFGLFVVSIIGNATIILPAPVFVFACAAGGLYGPVVAGVTAGVGSAIGEMTGYVAGYAGNAVIPQNLAVRYIERFMMRYGWMAIFCLAAIPNPLFDVGGIIAGMMRMPAHKFLLAAAAGKSVRLIIVGWACAGSFPAIEQWLSRGG